MPRVENSSYLCCFSAFALLRIHIHIVFASMHDCMLSNTHGGWGYCTYGLLKYKSMLHQSAWFLNRLHSVAIQQIQIDSCSPFYGLAAG